MRKFSDYLAIMILTPFAFGLSGSVMVKIQSAAARIELFKPLISFLIKSIPYVSMWMLFTIVYIVMPNTKVKFKYALVAGIFAGTVAMIFQALYQDLQIGVFRFNTLVWKYRRHPVVPSLAADYLADCTYGGRTILCLSEY